MPASKTEREWITAELREHARMQHVRDGRSR
jgi:hypothetical protein